jgi:hypothetical protein
MGVDMTTMPGFKNQPRAVSCDGKQRFDSATLAVKVAGRNRREAGSLSPYRCNHCNGWHLGHHIGRATGKRPRGEIE